MTENGPRVFHGNRSNWKPNCELFANTYSPQFKAGCFAVFIHFLRRHLKCLPWTLKCHVDTRSVRTHYVELAIMSVIGLHLCQFSKRTSLFKSSQSYQTEFLAISTPIHGNKLFKYICTIEWVQVSEHGLRTQRPFSSQISYTDTFTDMFSDEFSRKTRITGPRALTMVRRTNGVDYISAKVWLGSCQELFSSMEVMFPANLLSQA